MPTDRPPHVKRTIDPYASFIAEAALRFGIPERWIRVVLDAETGGDVWAISPKGAVGLMQLMPSTWAEMRARFALGPNPYDPRDNILAGAAYLRAMHDRFGVPGFLTAYNAGPARYLEHLSSGRPLPAETRFYLARLAPLTGFGALTEQQTASRLSPRAWFSAPIFTARSKAPQSDRPAATLERRHDPAAIDPAMTKFPDRPAQDRPRQSLEGNNSLNSDNLFVSPSAAKQ